MANNSHSRSFTLSANGINPVLISDVKLSTPYDPSKVTKTPPLFDYKAIWDTGATHTVITKKVATKLNLEPITFIKVNTAGGTKENVPVYLIGIHLPNQVAFSSIQVSEGEITGSEDVLIGMDIITAGDFAVTNKDRKTTFSYRYPAQAKIDFVTEDKKANIAVSTKVSRNTPCPCGSGKKYKLCCGKNS